MYQEMLELFNAYFELNKKKHNFSKIPLTIDIYCRTVKLSVIGVEFRDKLMGKNLLPPLLCHSNQPSPGQAFQRIT